MLENKESTLVEEGEDILDGLEMMEEMKEISETFLLDWTEIITSIIVARNMEAGNTMPTFQKDGKDDSTKGMTRICRAGNMIKIRKELMKNKERRKPINSRSVWIEDLKIWK